MIQICNLNQIFQCFAMNMALFVRAYINTKQGHTDANPKITELSPIFQCFEKLFEFNKSKLTYKFKSSLV
jgi:hypothetical protein